MTATKTYYATEPILHNGVLAYTVGMEVPASNVERHGYDKAGLVSTKFPADQVEELTREANVPGVAAAEQPAPAAAEKLKHT